MMKTILAAAALSLALAGTAAAQAQDKGPPQNAKKLSEIVAKVEQRADFRYIADIEWDADGYDVTYYTNDKAKVEIKFDAVSAEPK